jgi:glucose-6-phosphate isomerase, archaeal
MEPQMNLTAHPFSVAVGPDGTLKPATSTVERHLSQMRGMYHHPAAEEALLAHGDPLIYSVYQHDVPEFAGELVVCTTVLEPGKVGEEYFMTKGHYHAQRDRAEVYYGLQGVGLLVLAKDSESATVPISPGTVAYVPPYWAHRTINTGAEKFVFLAVYPGDAGHDYGTIETEGFPQVVLDREGDVAIVPREQA